MRILIVDDNNYAQVLLKTLLKDYGQLDIASNGFEAIDKIKQSYEDKAYYHLVLLDLCMPGKNGQTVLNEIRSFEKSKDLKFADTAKVIVVSALADQDNILLAFKNECESYIVKPVRSEQLFKEMKSLGFQIINSELLDTCY